MTVTPTHFAAVWKVTADYFKREVSNDLIALLYKALTDTAPDLTDEQFDYAMERAIARSRYMPTIVEVLSEVYEPLWRVRRGEGPQLPAVDPTRASEGLTAAFYAAQNARERWKQSQEAQRPMPGVFRLDRWQEIPGATLTPRQQRELEERNRYLGITEPLPGLQFRLPEERQDGNS